MMDEEKEDEGFEEYKSNNGYDLMEEFIADRVPDEFEEFCKECYEGYCDVEETKADLNRMIERI